MDEREYDYLKHEIRRLETSNRRWRLATFALAVPLAILVVIGVASSFVFGVMQVRTQVQRQRAVAAEAAARLQAAQQVQETKKQAKEEAEKTAKEQGVK